MKLIFFGTSAFGIPCLNALQNAGYRPLLVVTTPSKPSGRGLKVLGSPIKEYALAQALPLEEMSSIHEEPLINKARSLKPDLFVVTSFGVILKKEWLSIPSLAPINLHASILPQYRGASPMQMTLLNGDAETGVSVIKMIPKLDAGDILLTKKMRVTDHETRLTLEEKLSVLAADALMEAVSRIESGQAVWNAQEGSRASLCTKIQKTHGRLDWKKPAVQLDREIRAYLGWPGSYFFYQGKRFMIGKARIASTETADLPAGKIINASGQTGLAVACGQGVLQILELQMEGRKMLASSDLLKGFPLRTGDFFE